MTFIHGTSVVVACVCALACSRTADEPCEVTHATVSAKDTEIDCSVRSTCGDGTVEVDCVDDGVGAACTCSGSGSAMVGFHTTAPPCAGADFENGLAPILVELCRGERSSIPLDEDRCAGPGAASHVCDPPPSHCSAIPFFVEHADDRPFLELVGEEVPFEGDFWSVVFRPVEGSNFTSAEWADADEVVTAAIAPDQHFDPPGGIAVALPRPVRPIAVRLIGDDVTTSAACAF